MKEIDYKHKYLLLTELYCRETEALQAEIDELMFEYCPDEMTTEQIQEWADRQEEST